jgi:hypothetical protein
MYGRMSHATVAEQLEEAHRLAIEAANNARAAQEQEYQHHPLWAALEEERAAHTATKQRLEAALNQK